MKLKRIEWRNIGPFGNKLQTLDLPVDGGLWMVLGRNGAGTPLLGRPIGRGSGSGRNPPRSNPVPCAGHPQR